MKKITKIQRNKRGDVSSSRMTPEFERLVGKIEKDIKEKKNLSQGFSSSKQINDYLEKI